MTDPQPTDHATPSNRESGAEVEPAVRTKLNRKMLLITGGAVLVVAAVVGMIVAVSQPTALERAASACGGANPFYSLVDDEGTPAPTPEGDDADYVRDLFEGVVTVDDGGKTLIVQTKPQDDDPIGATSLALDCVYEELNVPRRVSELIGATRSLDGRQTGEWDNFSASWSYHPDNGLNLIIAQN